MLPIAPSAIPRTAKPSKALAPEGDRQAHHESGGHSNKRSYQHPHEPTIHLVSSIPQSAAD